MLRGEEGLKAALGRIPSGLYVVGAVHEGRHLGMLCSFVEQAGFEPPMISIALGTDRPMRQALEKARSFRSIFSERKTKTSLRPSPPGGRRIRLPRSR